MSKQIQSFIAKLPNNMFWLFVFYVLAIIVRFYVIRDYNFPFWFDPGRDAAVSREILEKHDLKIQGPNASGTGDTVFHGVLYYYLIGPLYTIFAGDPQKVLDVVIIISSLTIFAVYGLAFELSNKKSTAYLAAFLYVFSFDAIRGNTWLSNPIIASATIPFFFYFLYLIFFRKASKQNLKQQKYLFPLLALVLGLTHQSVILFIPLWGVVFLSFFYAAQDKNFLKNLKPNHLITSVFIYLFTIGSMILAQLKAWHDGIFSLSKLAAFAGASESDLGAVWGTARLFVQKASQLFPVFPVLSVLLVLILIIFIIKLKEKNKQIFFILVFISPLFLLSWHYRNMYHSFLGLESLLVVLLAYFIANLSKLKFAKYLQIFIIILFLISNILAFKTEASSKTTPYYLPQGAYLKEQLQLIEKSYELANGQNFSISSITNPYGYNTLWAYLYSWYGQKKYGYTPKFFGPNQAGIFAGDLLAETNKPEAIHFSIHEPIEGIPVWLRNDFDSQQKIHAGEILQAYDFGTLKLELR